MNFNENPEELKNEEQMVLDKLIMQMDKILYRLDRRMKTYVSEAKNADISVNPDAYLARVLAQQGKQNTAKNREKLSRSRDELYDTRLLLQYENAEESGIDEIKVGLHSCINGGDVLVEAWTMPLCRHYILDNAATDFETIVTGKYGQKYDTKYKLLVKNQVKLRFTRVKNALNLFPGIFDDKTLELIKGTEFLSDAYLDKMIEKFKRDEYNPDAAARIISDEFLQELLERRSTPEFKNIVFSIQKKQGEIVQASYRRNMVVQGCAGSGKSMIMLHRLPILLYDNPKSLKRRNLYIITPSKMYIQLANSMRHQLEISDINMGTIEEYYDYCISKYPGHKSGEYGKIDYTTKISSSNEQYVYSQKCIADICQYYDKIGIEEVPLERANLILNIEEKNKRPADTHAQRVNNRLLKIQTVINTNTRILNQYFKATRAVLEALDTLRGTLCYRKRAVLREITILVTKEENEIAKARKELKNLDSEKNAVAVQNRENIIHAAENRIAQLQEERRQVEADDEYFSSLLELNAKFASILIPFHDIDIKKEFSQNSIEDIYRMISQMKSLIDRIIEVSQEVSRVEEKYLYYLDAISFDIVEVGRCVSVFQKIEERYLEYSYYQEILNENEKLTDDNKNAIKNAYALIMEKIGIYADKNDTIKATKYSPYIYLQALYCYQGAPASRESLLAIDEVQGVAVEEIYLLRAINGKNVILNMFGDINQHIEGTKGVDSWDEYRNVIDFDLYEMKENYRNASQITEYCNRVFGMEMVAINTPGKGVHELKSESEFLDEMVTQLMDNQREGLSAILVGDDAEAKYLLAQFSAYERKFHDMTDDDFNIHQTKWNIINIADAKGLEFSTVIVLSGRMSRNEKYVAFTRALDDLYVYSGLIDTGRFEKKSTNKIIQFSDAKVKLSVLKKKQPQGFESKHKSEKIKKDYANSEVKKFFEEKGLEVIDARDQGGRLWVIGEKASIRDIINIAISKFGISGKYASSKESRNQNGWCTKTDK